MNTRIDRETLLQITDPTQERNIYVHPNALAREIFWQRIDNIVDLVRWHVPRSHSVLDFGGGSGVLARALSPHVRELHIVDLDPDDARNIKKKFTLTNVTVFQENINTFSPPKTYDTITAADVLEHFQDLSIPVRAIKRFLKDNGLLIISVPTENWIYEFGRKLVRKTKPADHYHPAAHIMDYLKANGFEEQQVISAPKFGWAIPLFTVAGFKLRERSA